MHHRYPGVANAPCTWPVYPNSHSLTVDQQFEPVPIGTATRLEQAKYANVAKWRLIDKDHVTAPQAHE
ncbi:MAG TPA: hypothetical protein VN880_03190 [Solirubrobacteraceae bacterium]|nr:hypothetical protein [Solirubrobacteraceae bacterium]